MFLIDIAVFFLCMAVAVYICHKFNVDSVVPAVLASFALGMIPFAIYVIITQA